MRQGSMRLLAATACLTVVLLISGYLIVDTYFDRKETAPLPAPEPARAGAPEPPVTPPPPAAAKNFEISGRLIDSKLRGLEGLEIACGGEAEISGAEGIFKLPALLREGPRPLAARRGGEELASWSEVFVGEGSSEIFGKPIAGQAARLRWTIYLAGPEENPKAWLSLQAMLVEDWGDWGRVQMTGTGRLPDGAHVYTAVYFEDDRIFSAGGPAELNAGKFQLSFALPENFRLYSTTYTWRLFFSTGNELPEAVEKWQGEHADWPWEELTDLQVSIPVFLGFPEEEKADDARIEAQYRGYLQALRRLKALLDQQSGEISKLARGWDPALLADREELRQTPYLNGAVEAQGKFLEPEWRRLIDEEWRPEVRELLNRFVQQKEDKFPKAAVRTRNALHRLLDLSEMTSAILYQKFGLPVHASDYYQDEEGYGGDRALLLKRLEDDLMTLERYCHLVTQNSEKSEKK